MGLILQLHPIEANLWASNAFNDVGIAIEFVGDFPTEKGVWWEGKTLRPAHANPGSDQFRPRPASPPLVNAVDIDFVFAHRQGYVSEARLKGPDPFRSELRQGSVSAPQVNQRSTVPAPTFGMASANGDWQTCSSATGARAISWRWRPDPRHLARAAAQLN